MASVGHCDGPTRILVVFRNRPDVVVLTTNPNVFTRRCRDCGWINAFEPLDGIAVVT